MTRDGVLRELLGGRWHTTHPDRFNMILRMPRSCLNRTSETANDGAHSKARCFTPTFGRSAVSASDVDGFEPEDYRRKYPVSSWCYLVPYRRNWRTSVWIEIEDTRSTNAGDTVPESSGTKATCPHASQRTIVAAGDATCPSRACVRCGISR